MGWIEKFGLLQGVRLNGVLEGGGEEENFRVPGISKQPNLTLLPSISIGKSGLLHLAHRNL